jgi:hypothetical protein
MHYGVYHHNLLYKEFKFKIKNKLKDNQDNPYLLREKWHTDLH